MFGAGSGTGRGVADGERWGREPEPPGAADHGGHLCPGGGVGRRGPCRPPRSAEQDRGADLAADPRGERPFEAPAGGVEIRVPAQPIARPGGAVGAAAGAPDLLRGVARERRRRPPRRPRGRPIAGGTGAACRPHPPGPPGEEMIMGEWLGLAMPGPGPMTRLILDSAGKGALIFAVAGVLAFAMRRGT